MRDYFDENEDWNAFREDEIQLEEDEEVNFEYDVERLEELQDREWELSLAVENFLAELISDDIASTLDPNDLESIKEKLLDKSCEMLAEEFGVYVYRPMFLEDKQTGIIKFEEYPYFLLM